MFFIFTLNIPRGLFLFTLLRLNNLVGVSSRGFDGFWLACWDALKWLFTCRSSPFWDVNLKKQPSKIHLNGLSPLCVRMCLSNQDLELDDWLYTLHPSQRQWNFSPVCCSTCECFKWSIRRRESKEISQFFHLHIDGVSLLQRSWTSADRESLLIWLDTQLPATDTGVHERDTSGVIRSEQLSLPRSSEKLKLKKTHIVWLIYGV